MSVYHFPWQNPALLDTIYPFRKQKLIDFLMVIEEIDLWQNRDNPNEDDQAAGELAEVSRELQREHALVAEQLQAGIEALLQVDKWFASIKGPEEKTLRFKRTYYINRMIQYHSEKLDGLQERKLFLDKRANLYGEGDTRREMWLERAAELDEPIQIETSQLNQLKDLMSLYEKQDRLPRLEIDGSVSKKTAIRWKLLKHQQDLENMTPAGLINCILDRFNQAPEAYVPWLRYMVIHFSGMRYRSAHGSWADPRLLLELLTREFLNREILSFSTDDLRAACEAAVKELEEEIAANSNPVKVRAMEKQISDLRIWNSKKALLEYQVAREIGEIQNLPEDEEFFLHRLEDLKQQRANLDDPLPDWVWEEIVKYTSLRLQTNNPNWEDTSPERWKYENRRWREILNAWEGKDITGWRQWHAETLDLVVTRAVCNEIAEHIQHLRGVRPAAGLAAKPSWYLNWQEKTKSNPDPEQRAYFKRPTRAADFKNGASILWLDWTDNPPNAWQVARPVGGFNFVPDRSLRLTQKKPAASNVEWNYYLNGASFQRIRRKATIRELKAKGLSKEEIEAVREDMRRYGGFVKHYLRWSHEAIVVGVADLLDGTYVLTFETGQIGIIRRRLADLVNNSNVFVGYVPPSANEPELLADHLDPARLVLAA